MKFKALARGRGRHARTPQGASARARRPEDQRAFPPHRQDDRRRDAGGILICPPLRDRKFVTLRWREKDSNPRSPVGDRIFSRPRRNPATTNRPGSQNRVLTIDNGRFTVRRAGLAPAMISTPGHRASRRRQRGACQPGREMLSPRRAPIERCSGSQHAHNLR